MREDLKDKEVLAMYDARGIQNYIFRSNKIKEIIGASCLVENIILEGMRSVIDSRKDWENAYFLTNWVEDDPNEFFGNQNIRMQVMFIGGGNAYVLFRTGLYGDEQVAWKVCFK